MPILWLTMDLSRFSDLLPAALAAQADGVGTVIVTVVANRSYLSAPAAARMLVREDGDVQGQVHPEVDRQLAADALAVLEARASRLRSYRVSGDGIECVGVQGGDLDVFFEVLSRQTHLIIVGAGHIAAPLARIGKLLDFHVTVLDDRPEYASRERFPDADEIHVGPYADTLARVPIDRDSCVVLVTRGHVHDLACLEQVIGSPAGYIGMIGSKRRVRTVVRHALERGHPLSRLQDLHAPIGLDIGAQTPAEIAVAIVAEIINVRRRGRGRSLALKERLRA